MAQHLFVASKMDKLNQKAIRSVKLFTNPLLLWQCNFRQVKSRSTGCSPVERSIGWCLSYKYCKRFPLSCLTVQESHFSRRYASKHVYVDPHLPASVAGWKHLKTVYFLESVDLTLALQVSWVLRQSQVRHHYPQVINNLSLIQLSQTFQVSTQWSEHLE